MSLNCAYFPLVQLEPLGDTDYWLTYVDDFDPISHMCILLDGLQGRAWYLGEHLLHQTYAKKRRVPRDPPLDMFNDTYSDEPYDSLFHSYDAEDFLDNDASYFMAHHASYYFGPLHITP